MSSLKEELEAFGAIRAGYEQAKALELLLKRCVWLCEYVSADMPDCEYAWTGAHMCVCVCVCVSVHACLKLNMHVMVLRAEMRYVGLHV